MGSARRSSRKAIWTSAPGSAGRSSITSNKAPGPTGIVRRRGSKASQGAPSTARTQGCAPAKVRTITRDRTALTMRSRRRERGGNVSRAGIGCELTVTRGATRPSAGRRTGLDARLIVERPIGEKNQHVAIGQWRVRLVDDERAIEPSADLLAGDRLDVGMVPGQPGIARGEPIFERLSRSDRRLGQAGDTGHRVWHAKPLDRERRRPVELVDEPNLDIIAPPEAKERTRHLAVIAPDRGRPGGFRGEAERSLAGFENAETAWSGPCLAGRQCDERRRERGAEKAAAVEGAFRSNWICKQLYNFGLGSVGWHGDPSGRSVRPREGMSRGPSGAKIVGSRDRRLQGVQLLGPSHSLDASEYSIRTRRLDHVLILIIDPKS